MSTRYILYRLLHAAYVFIAVITAAFFIIHLVPGDPVRTMLGFHASAAEVSRVRHQFGLDQPLGTQYLEFVRHVLSGNFGTSIIEGASVSSLIAAAVLPSLYLITASLVVTLAVSVPLALAAARSRNHLADHIIRLTTTAAFAMPSFWVGLLLAYVFGLRLGLLPVSGYGGGVGQTLLSLVLPSVTMALYLAPIVVRTLRASLIDALASEYVEAARARGVPERRVMTVHAMRNSLLPAITVLGANLGYLISGTVIVEEVFQIPGLGSLLVNGVLKQDYAVVQALTIIFAAAVILINLATDLCYPVIDHRVQLGAS